MTIRHTTIPDHLRGRLGGIELVSYSSGPTLGSVQAGGVAALVGLRAYDDRGAPGGPASGTEPP